MVDRREELRRHACVVFALGALLASGCSKNKAKAPLPPPAAAPVAVASAEPLSAPQTSVQLPPPQPIPPEAIPPEPVPQPEVTAEPAPPKPAPRIRIGPVPPPNHVPAAPNNHTTPARESPPASPGPQLRPLFTPEQERNLRRQIVENLTAAERSLSRLRQPQSSSADRVRAFMVQARQAQQEGDLNRARSLAERAALLAQDLVKSAR